MTTKITIDQITKSPIVIPVKSIVSTARQHRKKFLNYFIHSSYLPLLMLFYDLETQLSCLSETPICVFLLSYFTKRNTFVIPCICIIRIYLYRSIIALYSFIVFS